MITLLTQDIDLQRIANEGKQPLLLVKQGGSYSIVLFKSVIDNTDANRSSLKFSGIKYLTYQENLRGNIDWYLEYNAQDEEYNTSEVQVGILNQDNTRELIKMILDSAKELRDEVRLSNLYEILRDFGLPENEYTQEFLDTVSKIEVHSDPEVI